MTGPSRHQCPRCGGVIPRPEQPGAYPGALSRWDNRTEVCSACGLDEAVRDAGIVPGGPVDREAWFDRTGERLPPAGPQAPD